MIDNFQYSLRNVKNGREPTWLSVFLLLVVSNELALIGADRIQDQPNTDAEAIDEHILFADVSHLFPKFLVLSEYPFSVI